MSKVKIIGVNYDKWKDELTAKVRPTKPLPTREYIAIKQRDKHKIPTKDEEWYGKKGPQQFNISLRDEELRQIVPRLASRIRHGQLSKQSVVPFLRGKTFETKRFKFGEEKKRKEKMTDELKIKCEVKISPRADVDLVDFAKMLKDLKYEAVDEEDNTIKVRVVEEIKKLETF